MDLKQIRYLVAVADAGSFSAGARRAFVTQPTLSAAIAALEAEIGTRLLERRPRGVVATPEGLRVIAHARAVLRETEMIKTAGRQAAPQKPLRLGLLPTLPQPLVAKTMVHLSRLDPARSWQTEDAPLAVLRQRLANGRLDAIFTSLGDRAEPGHCHLDLARDRQVLALPARRRPRGRITPKILQGASLIVRTHCEWLQAASRILDDWQVRPIVVAKTDSDARALALVAAGIGACLLPDSLEHEAVAFVRVDQVNLTRRLGLEWIKGAGGGWLDRITQRL